MFQAKKDHDKKVFDCKVLSPDDRDEFEEVNSHFVDSFGWGREDEPALTPEQFLVKVRKDRFYAITGQGQFQVHVGEFIRRGIA